ncbi:hypothetical protein SmphiM6_21 [Sinorhizobium phage phiM6]|nr:hypothetical protein SmphiM6_21 [Sinorhizobium phage phiM6]
MIHKDWKKILKRAWSVRLMVLAAIFSGLEVAFPLFELNIPPRTFAIISGLLTAGALLTRFIAQKDFKDDDETEESR